MTMTKTQDWPPEDGKDFIRSDLFGRMLVGLTQRLAASHSNLDFSDAVAQVFVWFDRKLSKNRRFINQRRFPSLESFRAYLGQSIVNAALLSERRRRREGEVVELSADLPIASTALGPEQRVELLDMVETLPEPQKTILFKLAVDNEDSAMVAGILDLSEDEVIQLFEEAVDKLTKHGDP